MRLLCDKWPLDDAEKEMCRLRCAMHTMGRSGRWPTTLWGICWPPGESTARHASGAVHAQGMPGWTEPPGICPQTCTQSWVPPLAQQSVLLSKNVHRQAAPAMGGIDGQTCFWCFARPGDAWLDRAPWDLSADVHAELGMSCCRTGQAAVIMFTTRQPSMCSSMLSELSLRQAASLEREPAIMLRLAS